MSDNLDLFPQQKLVPKRRSAQQPLSDKLRPCEWDGFAGAEEIDERLLKRLKLGQGNPPSLILWGPPGSGKTTLAKLIGASFDLNFIEFSAVLGGVKDVRAIIADARRSPRGTLLFVDEIHRFNKAQQDAFLPHVEAGTIVLIGATTENPSFYLNSALLSRAQVVALPPLGLDSLSQILEHALSELKLTASDDVRKILIEFAGGDARKMINTLETIAGELIDITDLEVDLVKDYLSGHAAVHYDRAGDEHYNIASAFIKSLRGSDPDAALYWGFRMIAGGEDPRFLFRRLIIFASEDIGNADPRAVQIAVSGAEAFDRIGMPEGRIPLAQVVTYLASAPKSNRSYAAMNAAVAAVEEHPYSAVPLKLRNAPTGLMKDMGYGADYKYPHSEVDARIQDEEYLPEDLQGAKFYQPSDRGYEKTIAERLAWYRKK